MISTFKATSGEADGAKSDEVMSEERSVHESEHETSASPIGDWDLGNSIPEDVFEPPEPFGTIKDIGK
jgi:hypothetical protein